jgi:hypothetical protein
MANTIILGDGSTISINGTPVGNPTSIRFGGGGYEAIDASDLGTIGLRPKMQTLSEDGGQCTIEYHSAASSKPGRGNLAIVITPAGGVSAISFTAFLLNEENVVPMKGLFAHTMQLSIVPDDNPAQT